MVDGPNLPTPSRDDRVVRNQGLVHQIATTVWRSIGQSASLEDLVAYGQIGLVEAIDRYRPESGYEFSTFAYYRIRGSMLDGLNKLRGISRAMIGKVRFVSGVNELQVARTEEGSSPADVEETWGAIQESLRDGVAVFMLTNAGAAGEPTDTDDAESQVLAREWSMLVGRALGQLPAEEAELIRKVYFEDMNLAEAGERMGHSRSWACRLHKKAIGALRTLLERYANPPPSATVLR